MLLKNALLGVICMLGCMVAHAQGGLPKTDSVASARKDTLIHSVVQKKDSLEKGLKRRTHQLDSAKGRVSHKIDSLQRLNLSTARYTHQLDSLNKINPLKDVQAAESKLTAPAQKAAGIVSKEEGKLNSALGTMNKEAGAGGNLPGGVNLPNASLPNASLPGVSTNISTPGLSLPNETASIPNVNNPLAGGTGELANVEKSAGNLSNLPKEGLSDVKGMGEIGQVEKEMGQVNQLTQKASGVESDVKNITQGDMQKATELPKTLENEASKMQGMDQLTKESKALEGYEKMAGIGNDPEAMKKMALQQVQKEAVNHFAGKEQQLQAAMNKVSQLKMKYPNLKSLQDTLKKRPNAMHGKPLIERIVPGFTFQVLKTDNRTSVDFNPWIGYRFNGRLTAGAGWNSRMRLDFRHAHFGSRHGVYGPRVFGQFKLSKGFSARAELECMNTYVPPSLQPILATDQRHREWVWGVFAGIKKDYTLYKNIKGNVQMLYNVYTLFGHRPTVNIYGDALAVRLGFEFPMKNKKEAPKDSK